MVNTSLILIVDKYSRPLYIASFFLREHSLQCVRMTKLVD